MKTAISIDKNLFDEAEIFSQAAGLTRSRLYCIAINEYIRNNSPDIIMERLNSYYKNNDSRLDSDIKAAASRVFDKEDW